MARRKKPVSALRAFAIEFVLLCILGLIVAFATLPLLHFDAMRALDRNVSDLLMRELASEELSTPDARAPRFVFIDIDEQTCEEWALGAGMSCTKGWATPRDQLAAILETLARSGAAQQKPRLLVIDMELAPAAHRDEADPMDDRLCAAIVQIAQGVPVVALRPMVIRSDPKGMLVEAYPSILDRAFENRGGCVDGAGAAAARNNLWLASPLIQPDSEGIVRSVHAWDTIDGPAGPTGRIGGVGFLAAALLEEPAPPIEQLACDLPASKPIAETCTDTAMTIGRRPYDPGKASSAESRIVFLVPYTPSGVTDGAVFAYAPSTIETIAAKDFVAGKPAPSKLLGGAVVILGGSFLASDDLYTTPLGAGMPGALVHANAIRAFATGALVEEQRSWWLKSSLILVAALSGALFKLLGSLVKQRLPPILGELGEILVSAAGITVTVLAVFAIAVIWAFDDLSSTGTAIGTLTPAVAIALEGFTTIMSEIKHIAERAITSVTPQR